MRVSLCCATFDLLHLCSLPDHIDLMLYLVFLLLLAYVPCNSYTDRDLLTFSLRHADSTLHH